MYVVAIVALHHAFVDAMPEGTIKFRACFGVALVTESWLCGPQQAPFLFRGVDRVAGSAADAVGEVDGTGKVILIVTRLVALQALLAGLLGCQVLEVDDFGFVASTLNMS